MPVTFKEADTHLIDLAQELINEHHPWLREARIGLMYRSEAGGEGSHKTIGHARKVSEEMKVFMDFDFLIWIAEDVFASYSPFQRRALVDHELCHCGGYDGEWKIKKHDFEEFHVIIGRYGMWSENLKKTKEILDQPELPHVKVEIKSFSGMVSSVPADLLNRAVSDPGAFADDLSAEAQALREKLGGELTISKIQRELRIGYTRAAKLMDLIVQAEKSAKSEQEG